MAEIVGMWPGNGQRMSSRGTIAIKGGHMRELGEANMMASVFGQKASEYARTWPECGKGFARRCQETARKWPRCGKE